MTWVPWLECVLIFILFVFAAKPPASAEPPSRYLSFYTSTFNAMVTLAKPPAAAEPPSKVFLPVQTNMWRYGYLLQPSLLLPERRVSHLTLLSSGSLEVIATNHHFLHMSYLFQNPLLNLHVSIRWLSARNEYSRNDFTTASSIFLTV